MEKPNLNLNRSEIANLKDALHSIVGKMNRGNDEIASLEASLIGKRQEMMTLAISAKHLESAIKGLG